MAIAVPHDPDIEQLARQAEAFNARAERLRAEARSLAQQATDLRIEIGRRTREPVEILPQRVAPERDLRLLSKIAETLERIGPCKSTAVAEHLNVSQARALAGLRTLEQSGAVTRSGIRRGTIWGLKTDEDLSGHHPNATAYTLVRDAAIPLDTFDFETLSAALPMLSEGAIRRELPRLVRDGIFEEARDGKRKIWAYIPPEGPHVPRPKHKPPESKVVEFERKRGPVKGTGRRTQVRKDVAELLEACTAAGMEIKQAQNHWKILYGGVVVGGCPSTPSDHRSLLNCRTEIRRNSGIEI